MFFKVSLLLSVLYVTCINGHTYHTGGTCPSVEPIQGFDMRNFLGIWYAIQKTSTASTCIIYNITANHDQPGQYFIEQTSQHFALGLTPLKHEYSYTGELKTPDPDVPGKMTVKYPLAVGGKSSFTVFITDYQTFAGIYTCQKLGFTHRLSSTILSRTRTLDKIYVDKIRQRLGQYSIDPFDLSVIDQTGCPNPTTSDQGVNININPQTLSAKNIGNVFRKAGEKIGDGVEYVVNASKKVYGKLTNSEATEAIPTPSRNAHSTSADPDSEWIRV